MSDDITVVIPTHPSRNRPGYLGRALQSVLDQTLAPRCVIVENDLGKQGSAATRNAALEKVTTPWTAFLDSDDWLLPDHLQRLLDLALREKAHVAYSLPRVIGVNGHVIPRQHDWGGGPEFDAEYLRRKAHIQTTCLVRTRRAKLVGGFEFVTDSTGALNDDHGFFLRLLASGAKFAHLHEETFVWRHHGYGGPGREGNTSGRPERQA